MRTEQLIQCYEPLQKLRVKLGFCKTSLKPVSDFILLIVPNGK